jgi:hypothetical protein
VRTDNNGVFPRYTDLKGLKICEVRKKMVRMPFRDTYILYESISEQLKRFHEKIPCKIEGIPLNLQSICARCPYLEDCKHTLNFKEEIDPKSWDLRLLPYTSRTISEQLRDSISPQYETIEDVANKIQNHPTDNVPTPLFAEKPFLELRAKSLLMKKPISPEEGKSFSLTLPKYNDISLTIDLETDAIHDVVCSAAFYLEVFISQNSLYYHNFNDW